MIQSGPLATFIFAIDFLSTDFNIFSPLQSQMVGAYIWNRFRHLTSIALPHYRVNYEQVQFCKKTSQLFYWFSRKEKYITVIWADFYYVYLFIHFCEISPNQCHLKAFQQHNALHIALIKLWNCMLWRSQTSFRWIFNLQIAHTSTQMTTIIQERVCCICYSKVVKSVK